MTATGNVAALASTSPTGADPVVTCRGVRKSFGRVDALRGLDLEVLDGSVTGFLGPNGAGKTTTLRLLLGLSRPDEGTIQVLGHDPWAAPPRHRREIGYLPGELQLDDRFDVGDTLSFWADLRGIPDDADVRELCERLSLDPTRPTRGLSSGNRRKVGLVGALMGRPRLLVLDEPTSGLDPVVQAEFAELVQEVRTEGRTILLSSHIISEVQHLADQVVLIREGATVLAGSVDDLRRRAVQPFTAWFTNDPPVAELQAMATDVEVRGRHVTGRFEGDPNALIRLIAEHPVDHLLLPEPDLEDVFLRYYGGRS
jgi:ABC-2 type transport system ATP-binding protein